MNESAFAHFLTRRSRSYKELCKYAYLGHVLCVRMKYSSSSTETSVLLDFNQRENLRARTKTLKSDTQKKSHKSFQVETSKITLAAANQPEASFDGPEATLVEHKLNKRIRLM